MRNAGVGGDVTLRFVLDSAGVVDSGSVVVIRSPHDLFTAEARRELLKGHGSPALILGRPVRQILSHTFSFSPSDGDCRVRAAAAPDTTLICGASAAARPSPGAAEL
jgi:hypothetical protein